MSNNDSYDDLVPVDTKGYKPGTKKTLDEYNELDANDESLRKWKESLGINKAADDKIENKPKVVVLSLALEVEGRDDIVIDLSDPSKPLCYYYHYQRRHHIVYMYANHYTLCVLNYRQI